MRADEHVQTAWDFLAKSDMYFADGDRLQGSEKLWGAAAHAILAVSRVKRWQLGSHSRLRENAARLSYELSDSEISDDFQIAEKFHSNFYHGYMEDFRLVRDRPFVHRFVNRVLALPDLRGLNP